MKKSKKSYANTDKVGKGQVEDGTAYIGKPKPSGNGKNGI